MSEDKRVIRADALEKLRQTVIGLFSDNQFHEVGIRDICKQAGVSPQTVYKYYGNKQELLLACIEQDLAQLTSMCSENLSNADNLRTALEALTLTQFAFYAERPTIARIVFMNLPAAYWIAQRSEAQTAYQTLLIDQLKVVEHAGLLPNNMDVTLIQDIATGAASRVITRWLMSDCEYDLNEKADAFFDLIWMALPEGVKE